MGRLPPGFHKRPFPFSTVTFNSKRNKLPSQNVQPIFDSYEDYDYPTMAFEKKGIKQPMGLYKRPFPMSTVTFNAKRNMQPIFESEEDYDYPTMDFENKLNKRPFFHSKVRFHQNLEKRLATKVWQCQQLMNHGK